MYVCFSLSTTDYLLPTKCYCYCHDCCYDYQHYIALIFVLAISNAYMHIWVSQSAAVGFRRTKANLERKGQVVQHCSLREPRTKEHLVQQCSLFTIVSTCLCTTNQDCTDDHLDEVLTGRCCWPSKPFIFKDSQVLPVERCVKEDQCHFVASKNFPEIRTKSSSFYLVPLLSPCVVPLVCRCLTHPCPILFLPLVQ